MLPHVWWWFQHLTGTDNTAGRAYGFWSGFGSDIGEVTLIAMAITWYRTHECHVDNRAIGGKNCHKFGKHPFEHYKLCKDHHPNVPQKVTHLHIAKLHKEKNK